MFITQNFPRRVPLSCSLRIAARLVLIFGLVLIAGTICAQDSTEASGNARRQKVKHVWPEETWARVMMQRLKNFFPKRLPRMHTYTFDMIRLTNSIRGIEARIGENEPSQSMGCRGAGGRGCHLYYPGTVDDVWHFDDPEWLSQYVASRRQEEALIKSGSPSMPETEFRTLQARLAEQAKKSKEIESRPHGGQVNIEIAMNNDEWTYLLQDANHIRTTRQVGTVQGLPLYRTSRIEGGVRGEPITDFWIYLGTSGFKNPWSSQPAKMEVKTILVHFTLISPPEAAKSQEAEVRQMLESMDWAGLKKIVQP